MKNFCATLCHVAITMAVAGCSSSHGNTAPADASVDATGGDADVALDSDVPRDAAPDAPGTCPATGALPVWNATTPCSTVGLNCSDGSTSVCGSAYSCTCEASGFWSCYIAEPDPACWCGRYPDVGTDCNTEGQECRNGSVCDDASPPLVCRDRHWQVNEATSCNVHECPAEGWEAAGTACSVGGEMCDQAICCEYTNSEGTRIPESFLECNGGYWINQPIAVDCVPEVVACDGFPCGRGFCGSDAACVARCGPSGGAVYSCVSIEETELSCAALVEALELPPEYCSVDEAGHIYFNAAFCI